MMPEQNIKPNSEPEALMLQSCPETVQLMPAENIDSQYSLLISVLGNTLVGILLLGGLISAPAWVAGLLATF